MAKNSIEAYKAEGKTNLLLMLPEKLHIVEDDTGSALYDPERANLPLDEALVLNIKEHGVIEPCIIWKDPETGKVFVVDGRQRTKCCVEANKRRKKEGLQPHTVPCVPRRDKNTLMEVMISTFIRQDDTPINRAKKLARYMDLGHSEEQAAVTFGISKSTVRNMLGLAELPKDWQKAVQSGKVAASVAYTVKDLPAEEQKSKLAEILSSAPKAPGRKRSANGKKAREIATGKSDGKGKRELLAWIKKLESGEVNMKEMHRAGAVAALMLALGDEAPIKALMA
jgi:ParB family chromosome partitioning protein